MKPIIACIVSFLFFISPSVSAGGLFSDIHDSDPGSVALQYLTQQGVVEGYSDGSFRPQGLINRAEFIKMVVEGVAGVTPARKDHSRCFPDTGIEWFARYVCYAEQQEWVKGYPDGLFHPGDPITRAEAAVILTQALSWRLDPGAVSAFQSHFQDNRIPDTWYWEPLVVLEEWGMFDTLDSNLSPHELLTRKQMAELLYRALKKRAGEPFVTWGLEDTYDRPRSYSDMLATGIQPAYPPDMKFPAHSQKGWPYGCYSFATKNVMEFKYGEVLDIADVQKRIGWDGTFIWSEAEFEKFAEIYNVDVVLAFNGSAEFFLKKLALGEPLVFYIPLYVGETNVGHQLVAYSFDQEGVWVADSLGGGKRHRIPYDQVFSESPTYNINLTQFRRVKAGGEKKYQ